jgi:NADH:ubiquinone oxidoreductase subunit 6 (subunit J)
MSPTLLKTLLIAVMVGVVFVLLRGLINMVRGGTPERSNEFMRWRVFLQFIAIAIVLLALWLGQWGN